jgi:hypothetical protein
MQKQIKDRAFKALNLEQFSFENLPDMVSDVIELDVPEERQYVLRMLVKKPHEDFKLPETYSWVKPILNEAINHQLKNNIRQPFVI